MHHYQVALTRKQLAYHP